MLMRFFFLKNRWLLNISGMLVNSVYGKYIWRPVGIKAHSGSFHGLVECTVVDWAFWYHVWKSMVCSFDLYPSNWNWQDFGSLVGFPVPGEYRMYLEKAVATSKLIPIHACVLPFDPIGTEALLHRKKQLKFLLKVYWVPKIF